jgi:hypothetical protein
VDSALFHGIPRLLCGHCAEPAEVRMILSQRKHPSCSFQLGLDSARAVLTNVALKADNFGETTVVVLSGEGEFIAWKERGCTPRTLYKSQYREITLTKVQVAVGPENISTFSVSLAYQTLRPFCRKRHSSNTAWPEPLLRSVPKCAMSDRYS